MSIVYYRVNNDKRQHRVLYEASWSLLIKAEQKIIAEIAADDYNDRCLLTGVIVSWPIEIVLYSHPNSFESVTFSVDHDGCKFIPMKISKTEKRRNETA